MAGRSGKPHKRGTNALTAAGNEKTFGVHIGAQIIGRPLRLDEEMAEYLVKGHQNTPHLARWPAPCRGSLHGLGLHRLFRHAALLRGTSPVATRRQTVAARRDHD